MNRKIEFIRAKKRILKTINKTQRYLTYHDSPNGHICSKTNKIGLLSSVSFSKRHERLKIIFEKYRIYDMELLKIFQNLIEVDLAIELIGLCGKMEIINDISFDNSSTHLKFFKEFVMGFIVNKISNENSVSTTCIEWKFNVLAKLKAFFLFLKNKKLDKIQNEYQKSLANLINNQSFKDRLNQKVTITMENWNQEWIKFIKQTNEEKYKFVKSKMFEFLIVEENLKTDLDYLDDYIILTKEEYAYIDNYHENTNTITNRNKMAYKEGFQFLRVHDESIAGDGVIKNPGSEATAWNQGTEAYNVESDDRKLRSDIINYPSSYRTKTYSAGSEEINDPSLYKIYDARSEKN